MKNYRIELRWAILFSFILMIWMTIENKFLGWHHKDFIGDQYRLHFFVILPIIYSIIYYIEIRNKRIKYYDGMITWKEGLISGAMMSVIITILSPLTQFFIYHYIAPDYFQNMIYYQ